MKIVIYNNGIAFDGTTPLHQPLGGSESSVVYMARNLARCGHDVTVYCNTPSPGASHRPLPEGEAEYVHYHQFFTDYTSARWDVLISFRSFDPFLLGRVAARMIYWTGDASDQPALEHFEHAALQENIDLIFCVSNWHRRSFIEAFDLPSEKVIATRNGFCPELTSHATVRQWSRCAYSSTPFRGLEILLKMFPLMRACNSDLELDVFSSMKVYGWTPEADQNAFGAIYEHARQPGVSWHGSVAQPVLLKNLGKTGLFLYPNTFAETSCIAAIEAQASGCVVVTSARAALNETVQNGKTGVCLQGNPASADYQQEFIATVTGLLRNPARLAELSDAAMRHAFQYYAWLRIASEWTDMFAAMPARAVHSRRSGPLSLLQKTHEYLQKGNVSAATRVLAALEQTPFLKNEVEAVKGQLSTWM
ncbi:MAG TPA: glycosyltransferase family 4 protein [Terriglobia bacterium]|nr:glycosyltransferase family 4 protein [Terriglobia bacterium]